MKCDFHWSLEVFNEISNKKLMIISFDGFGYQYLNPSLTPNMYQLATMQNGGGVTGHMYPTFSTKTLPNHHSISTGLYQDMHGIMHNYMYDPIFEEHFVDGSPRDYKWWDNLMATPIFIANQLYDRRRSSCCSPWIGCHARYFDGRYQARYFLRFNRSSCFYKQFEWSLQKMQDPGRPANLVMIYIHEPDMTGHRHGPFGRETLQQVYKLDQFVGHIRSRMEQLNLTSHVNVIILADHGLSEIHPYRSIVMDSFLNTSWYEAYGSNPVFTIRIKPGFESIVWKILVNQSKIYPFRVYRKCQIPEQYHYRNHRRIRDLLVVAKQGWSIYKSWEQWEKERQNRGQHGYDNLDEKMRPIFLAFGPSFKSGYHHRHPFMNVDLYPLMLKLLDIDPREYYHQGNLSNVIHMLNARLTSYP